MSAPTPSPDNVFAVARSLLLLEERLARLDEERGKIQAEIADAVSRLARVAVDTVRPNPAPAALRYPTSASRGLRGVVLNYIGRNPSRVFKTDDLIRELKITNRDMKENLRTILSRLSRAGLIARTSYGSYQAKALP
jgi:hypothetical protein